jgi:hypothetical protein
MARPWSVLNLYLPFVGRVALVHQMARRFEAFDRGRYGAGFQVEAGGDAADGLVVILPQHAQHQVLRIGQAELIQPRLVGPAHGHKGAVERKGQLPIQRQGGICVLPPSPAPMIIAEWERGRIMSKIAASVASASRAGPSGRVWRRQRRARRRHQGDRPVHGGFVDGSGWEGVYDILSKDGHKVTVVQNPTTSLADESPSPAGPSPRRTGRRSWLAIPTAAWSSPCPAMIRR